MEMMNYREKFIKEVNEEPVKADTEFETMWRTAQREAKRQALEGFFISLEGEVFQEY